MSTARLNVGPRAGGSKRRPLDLLDEQEQLLVPVQRRVQVVVAQQAGPVARRIVLVREVNLVPWRDPEPLADLVVQGLEKDVPRDADRVYLAVEVELDLHRRRGLPAGC